MRAEIQAFLASNENGDNRIDLEPSTGGIDAVVESAKRLRDSGRLDALAERIYADVQVLKKKS